MTESEWNACNDPQVMLELLRGKASDRKLRLFAVACCRQVLHLLKRQKTHRTLEMIEDFADGIIDIRQLQAACAKLDHRRHGQQYARWAVQRASIEDSFSAAGYADTYASLAATGSVVDRTSHAVIIRELT